MDWANLIPMSVMTTLAQDWPAVERIEYSSPSYLEKIMADLSTLAQYYKLADQLIEKVSKEDLAECARLMALNVAHYQSKYGELPMDETLAMFSMDRPNAAQIQMLTDGMEIFVGVLGNVVAGIGQERH